MIRAQLMRHRVADAEERVGKRHTGHRRGALAIFSRLGVGRAVFIAAGQVIKHVLHRLERKAVGVVGRHHRSVSLEAVGQHVDAGGGGQSAWHGSSC